jgi:hypothetical protein
MNGVDVDENPHELQALFDLVFEQERNRRGILATIRNEKRKRLHGSPPAAMMHPDHSLAYRFESSTFVLDASRREAH